MNLSMPALLALNYSSARQQARVVTEAWGQQNLYCPNCQSHSLNPTPVSTAAIDFFCPHCGLPFQLKSSMRPFGNRITDAAYGAMMRAIAEGNTPNLYALHYNRASWQVQNLILIPHFAFTASAVRPMNPTRPRGRSSDWVGCYIQLTNIPADARINLVSDGVPLPPHQVRESFRRIKPLEAFPLEERGWALDVLRIVRDLGKREFSNSDVYAFQQQLERLHPRNRHVRDKIRQQLQVLRDRGFIVQVSRGVWALREQINEPTPSG